MTFFLKIDHETELKQLDISEAETLFNLVDKNRPYLGKWLPWLDFTNSSEDSKSFIQASKEKLDGNKAMEAGIWYKDQLVGVIGLHEIDWVKEETAIGYWLGQDFQGHGLITRATKAVLEHCFNELKLKKVEIRCAIDNTKSRAIPERLGFKQERIKEQAELLYGKIVDHAIYSLNREQWQ